MTAQAPFPQDDVVNDLKAKLAETEANLKKCDTVNMETIRALHQAETEREALRKVGRLELERLIAAVEAARGREIHAKVTIADLNSRLCRWQEMFYEAAARAEKGDAMHDKRVAELLEATQVVTAERDESRRARIEVEAKVEDAEARVKKAEARIEMIIAASNENHANVEDDVRRGLKLANALTLETQTVEDAITDLVRMVRAERARAEKVEIENMRLNARVRYLLTAIGDLP